jgi:hypothetical protein
MKQNHQDPTRKSMILLIPYNQVILTFIKGEDFAFCSFLAESHGVVISVDFSKSRVVIFFCVDGRHDLTARPREV